VLISIGFTEFISLQEMSSRVLNADKRVWTSDASAPRSLAVVIAASFAVILPAILWGIPSNLDLTNHFRFALPFHDAIVAGNLYPSWLAESTGGYGDPSFRFYPPALYYFLAVTRFVIGDWYVATLAVYVSLSIASGLGMYFWTRSFLPASTATWAAIFYALAPYHVNQLYQAVLLAEWAGSAVLPFVFGFLERVCDKGRTRDVAGLAATYALLIFTHLPLAVIGSIALLVYALVKTRQPGKLAKLALGAILGLALSAVYWVTMVSEVSWIGLNNIKQVASVDYRFNFIFSTFSPDNLSVWWMNVLVLMTFLLCAPAFLLVFKNGTSSKRVVLPAFALTVFSLFMSVPLSRPIWTVFKPLQETQFPWRWMVLISMGASILAAAGLPLLPESVKKLDRAKRLVVFVAMAISVVFTVSHIVREAQYFPAQRFEQMLTEVRGTSSLTYWFPVWSRSNPRQMATEVEVADREVTVKSWQPEHRKFSVTAGAGTESRVRTFYYPHWIAKNESGVLSTRPDIDGALLISLPPNATSVELDFEEPRRSRFSTIASLSGLIITGALAVPLKRRRKHDRSKLHERDS
jgi:uncharacterized membrane protein